MFDDGRIATLKIGCAIPPFWFGDKKFYGKGYEIVRNAIRRGKNRDSSRTYCTRKDSYFKEVVNCVKEDYDNLKKSIISTSVPEECPYYIEQTIEEWNI